MTREIPGWHLTKLSQAICLASVLSGPAFGGTFKLGEVEGKLDSTLSVGASWSVRSSDPELVGAGNKSCLQHMIEAGLLITPPCHNLLNAFPVSDAAS